VNSLRAFLGFDRAVQVLLVNQLAVNTGFFVLYPYLAAHMTGALGLPAWMAGLVLGFGTLSQQGLFLVGGTLADRLGYRRVILSGLAIRALGFLLFGLANNLPLLLAAAFLSGFAGALFNPAVRAYLAEAAGPRRVEAFAFFGVFANAGLLLGPVVGAVLVGFGFTLSSTVAAGVFVVLTVVQALALPARPGRSLEARPGVLADWRSVFGHRAFLLFGLPMLGYFALYVQFYLGLPLAMRRATSEESAVGLIIRHLSSRWHCRAGAADELRQASLEPLPHDRRWPDRHGGGIFISARRQLRRRCAAGYDSAHPRQPARPAVCDGCRGGPQRRRRQANWHVLWRVLPLARHRRRRRPVAGRYWLRSGAPARPARPPLAASRRRRLYGGVGHTGIRAVAPSTGSPLA